MLDNFRIFASTSWVALMVREASDYYMETKNRLTPSVVFYDWIYRLWNSMNSGMCGVLEAASEVGVACEHSIIETYLPSLYMQTLVGGRHLDYYLQRRDII